MSKVPKVALADTTAEVLRRGLISGRWRTKLPGQIRLAKELGVSRRTLRTAISRLAREGVISSAEAGKVPVILKTPASDATPEPVTGKTRGLRIAILTLLPLNDLSSESRQNVLRILMDLQNDGHQGLPVILPEGKKTAKTSHLQRVVQEARADAWLVFEGTEEVLRWFIENGPPAMALGGGCRRLPISATGWAVTPFITATVNKLTSLGHRRIVLISPKHWRHPAPLKSITAFRRGLIEAGVTPGEYHTPEWEESPEGLDKLLVELFRVTPPTAIVCCAEHTVFGIQAWMKGRKLRIPEDLSVVSQWDESLCAWYAPGLRIAKPSDRTDTMYYRHVRKWVRGVAMGKNDTHQALIDMRLDEGNSIGPPKTA